MRSPTQTVAEAERLYLDFMSRHIANAEAWAAQSRKTRSCVEIGYAIRELGIALHAYSDSLSPAHRGFQMWAGPVDGIAANEYNLTIPFGANAGGYAEFALAHNRKETMTVYNSMSVSVVGAVRMKFQETLDALLKR
jgi:hypothetical protein